MAVVHSAKLQGEQRKIHTVYPNIPLALAARVLWYIMCVCARAHDITLEEKNGEIESMTFRKKFRFSNHFLLH